MSISEKILEQYQSGDDAVEDMNIHNQDETEDFDTPEESGENDNVGGVDFEPENNLIDDDADDQDFEDVDLETDQDLDDDVDQGISDIIEQVTNIKLGR